jgi:DNA-binding response OmpR family regulator
MLTARTSAKSRIKGLEIGADDYLTKPFHLEEFLLRVDKMLAREKRYSVKQRPSKGLILGDKRINFDTLEVISSDAETLRLTDREARVLRYLVRNQGTIVSRKDLLQNVWKTDSNIETRTVDVFVARLRKYFEPDPKAPIYIKSVRGSGYLFENRDDPF